MRYFLTKCVQEKSAMLFLPYRNGKRNILPHTPVSYTHLDVYKRQAQVHILIIGKEQLVKDADLVQNGFAVECCAAAGAENAAGLCICLLYTSRCV